MKPRHGFILALLFLTLFVPLTNLHAGELLQAKANEMVEWSLVSQKSYTDPFNEIELDVIVTTPDGGHLKVPAFWAGGQTWRMRYASSRCGTHSFVTVCSDRRNSSLDGIKGVIEIKPYAGTNAFFLHGPVRVAADKKHFEHADGTPFFWLADAWYMGLCRRLTPDEFKLLVADRVGKGFNVAQIVAGFYPDMAPFDERGAGEGGFPWTQDYARINPKYFDAADARIKEMTGAGIAPCIFGGWGYDLPPVGLKRMKKYWRYLVARYGALPVFWCLAGEGTMPYYLSTSGAKDTEVQKTMLTQLAAWLRHVDPYHHPVSIHPPAHDLGREQLKDPALIDFDMVQAGHDDRRSIAYGMSSLRTSRGEKLRMPVIDAEACYEGIRGLCLDDIQRYFFWRCMLEGAAGHSYGANGIWQANHRGQPFGASPGNGNWGNTPWDEAAKLPGSRQLGLAKHLLEDYEWWKFEPHSEWVWPESPARPFSWGGWIWFPEGNPAKDALPGKYFFRRAFEFPGNAAKAFLRVAVDDNLEVSLNGEWLGAHIGWKPYREFEITRLLKAGKNVIAIRAEKVRSGDLVKSAGLLCNLEIRQSDGKSMEIQSDSEWRCSRIETVGWTAADFDDQSWSKALVMCRAGDAPWGEVTSPDYYLVPDAAGIPGRVRIAFLPTDQPVRIEKLEPGKRYRAAFVNPLNGERVPAGMAEGNEKNTWRAPDRPGGSKDWALVLEAQ
ncbi:MAG TPA: DUF4038 domain-containing protein [Verrucomicrobiae bacterium]|nr:DUF4038 domain-containing protein [Verrucomicrobiae bacterium]